MYSDLLVGRRRRESSVSGRDVAREADSDHDRIVFSAPFRRLQQKAQVFSLEDNAAVRSRLTHSIEVASIGRSIALEIMNNLRESGRLKGYGLAKSPQSIAFTKFVETACLAHDIGNTPFGHFGETAIQQWFTTEERVEDTFRSFWGSAIDEEEESILSDDDFKQVWEGVSKILLPDFRHFDGNPQGFRILSRLQWKNDEYSLNLTAEQLATCIKYPKYAGESCSDERLFADKKPGYFLSELGVVEDVFELADKDRTKRFPLAYIMEAADDIAYCMSDIEDGIEKGILSEDDFFRELDDPSSLLRDHEEREWDFSLLRRIRDHVREDEEDRGFVCNNLGFFRFKVALTRELTKQVAACYCDNHEKVYNGRARSLVELKSEVITALETLKSISGKWIYDSEEAERPELAGDRIVSGLLERLSNLLKITEEEFVSLESSNSLERRLWSLIPDKHLTNYEYWRENRTETKAFEKVMEYWNTKRSWSEETRKTVANLLVEWFLRAHLITDFIAGMTDNYALEIYQVLHGIRTR